ncbi:MAG: hypothetical protein JRH01_09230 [Deltaproteobacteria bacterium]|nr:hypothetical protein [Deltaproteobacteria bacterium]MBW2393129.1 hypothetical protein [Deltaproteobacteria bacterium]
MRCQRQVLAHGRSGPRHGWALVPLLALLALPLPAQAGTVVDAEVENLRSTAQSLAIAAATSGNSVRGASGYLDSMLRQSDQLICNSWILGFSISVRRMAVALGDSPSVAELKAYQAMVALRDKIVEKCGPITDPDTHSALGSAAASGTTEGATQTTPPRGAPFVPRKNWNIVDQICWDKCSRLYFAYRQLAREAERRQKTLEQRKRASADAKRALTEEKRALAGHDADAKARDAESETIQNELRRARGTSRAPLVERLGNTLTARRSSRAAAGRARTAIQGLEKELEKARKDEARSARLARAADADAAAALKAYEACLKKCYASAQKAGEHGAALDSTRDNPARSSVPRAAERALLERIRAIRAQEEARASQTAAQQARGAPPLILRAGGRTALPILAAPSATQPGNRAEATPRTASAPLEEQMIQVTPPTLSIPAGAIDRR